MIWECYKWWERLVSNRPTKLLSKTIQPLEYSNSIITSCYGFIVTTSLKIIEKSGKKKSSTQCVFESTIKFILL